MGELVACNMLGGESVHLVHVWGQSADPCGPTPESFRHSVSSCYSALRCRWSSPRSHSQEPTQFYKSALVALIIHLPPCHQRESLSLTIPPHRPCPTSSVAQETTIAELTLKFPLEATDRSVITKIADQVIANTNSSAYVLKTSRSPNSKKLRAAVAFVPRLSHFDVENERSSTNEFRVRPYIRAFLPSHVDPHATRQIGVFHTVLDFALYLDCSHIHPKHRDTWCPPQLPICDHDLKRRANTSDQRCRARFEHGNLRTIRKGGQQRLDQVLLDWCRHSAYTPNIRTFRRYQVDFQSVCVWAIHCESV